MSLIKKILLAASCVFYAMTIVSYFNFSTYLTILLFLLHSLCLILFCYRTYAEVDEQAEENETRQQDIGLQLAEKETRINDLKLLLTDKENSFLNLTREHDLLKFDVEKLNERIKELVEKAEEKEAEEKELMGEAKDISSLLPPAEMVGEDGKSAVVNIVEIAKGVCNDMRDRAKSADIRLSVSSAEEELLVKVDSNRMKIMFMNIIDNSIKYMKRAGSLVITISALGDDIFIVLKDTGEGLSQRETKRIFELNYQGLNRVSGNGLGLAQAKAIVEYYGGTIYAKSKLGGGMGIYIQLPSGSV